MVLEVCGFMILFGTQINSAHVNQWMYLMTQVCRPRVDLNKLASCKRRVFSHGIYSHIGFNIKHASAKV